MVVKCESSSTAEVTLDPACVYLVLSERQIGGFQAVDLIGLLVNTTSGSIASRLGAGRLGAGRLGTGSLGAASGCIDLRSWLLASCSSCMTLRASGQVSAHAL